MIKKIFIFIIRCYKNNNLANHIIIKWIRHPTTIICEHLLGENHSHGHKAVTGILVMICGVMVSKVGAEWPIHLFTDLVGYGIHGIGLLPFIENLEKRRSKENENDSE